MLMYQWFQSIETRSPLYTSCLIVCIWLDRHTLEMDALRKIHAVRAAELSEQVTQLQVKLPFMGLLIWAASHVQGGLTAVPPASTQSSSTHMPVPGMSYEKTPCDALLQHVICHSLDRICERHMECALCMPSEPCRSFMQATLAALQVSLYALQYATCALHCPACT